jgi:hypothetical protein
MSSVLWGFPRRPAEPRALVGQAINWPQVLV